MTLQTAKNRLSKGKSTMGYPIEKFLSRTITLLDGREITITNQEDARISRDRHSQALIHLQWLNESPLHQAIFWSLGTLLSTHSLGYPASISLAARQWFDVLGNVVQLDVEHLNDLHKLPSNYGSFIVPLLRRLALSHPEVLSEDLKDFLNIDYKWERKGNGEYFALKTNDPERGTLTDQELLNIHGAITKAHIEREISLENYTLIWMFIGTGLRPTQIAQMNVGDVQISKGPDGQEVTLNCPLAKGTKTASKEYWLRRAPSVLADCLVRYLSEKQAQSDEPLFPAISITLAKRIIDIFDRLDTWSDRLQGQIPITPYRFRYTLATRALRQGADDYTVARLLTHRDTRSIHHYRASMPDLQKPISDAIGKEMDYFARAFQGKLINDISERTRSDEGEALIRDFMRLTGQTLGACGTCIDCHQNAPVACMTCVHFEPLLTAPWEDLMAKLVEDQERESEERIRQINFAAMSAINEIIEQRDAAK